MILKYDCKYFPGDKPCVYHKKEGVMCDKCPHYSPAKNLILIIKLDAIGDVLRTTSLLPALKSKYPDSVIYWITKSNAKELFKGNSFVDEVIAYEEPFLNSFIKNTHFDLIINLDPSRVSSSLASYAEGKKKIGFGINDKGKVYPFNKEAIEWFEMGAFDNLKAANKKTYQEIIHNVCSLEYKKDKIILNLTETEFEFAKDFYTKNNLSEFDFIIGINAGASNRWEYKKWRKDGYIEVMNMLSEHFNVGFLLYGGKNEIELNKDILDSVANAFNAGSNNTLRELSALISLSDILITGDTLAVHIAAALGINTICIFGPTSHSEIEDYGTIKKVYPDMKCLVCYKNTCDFDPVCMELVTAEMIYNNVITILKNINKI